MLLKTKEEEIKMTEREFIKNQICKVAQTDFNIGFDVLFRFMAEFPESKTTEGFVDYHLTEKDDPRISSGDADFTYLIGKDFIAEHWVHEDELKDFLSFAYREKEEVYL